MGTLQACGTRRRTRFSSPISPGAAAGCSGSRPPARSIRPKCRPPAFLDPRRAALRRLPDGGVAVLPVAGRAAGARDRRGSRVGRPALRRLRVTFTIEGAPEVDIGCTRGGCLSRGEEKGAYRFPTDGEILLDEVDTLARDAVFGEVLSVAAELADPPAPRRGGTAPARRGGRGCPGGGSQLPRPVLHSHALSAAVRRTWCWPAAARPRKTHALLARAIVRAQAPGANA